MPHNTNVTDVNPPYGGYPKVVEAGWNDNYLPLWLQEAGYSTYYVGKLWNSHSTTTYNKPYARGFNQSDFLLDPYTYRYYDSKMTRNGAEPVSYRGKYSTDVVAEKASGFLDDALSHKDQPWMLTVAPASPHSNGSYDPSHDANWFGDPEYPDRYADMFKDYQIPRDASFNKPIQGAVGWVKQLTELNDTLIQYNDEFQRKRLRALQAVDDMIGNLVEKLDKAGALDNTYIFFAADNGYHISQHQMKPGKNCGYGKLTSHIYWSLLLHLANYYRHRNRHQHSSVYSWPWYPDQPDHQCYHQPHRPGTDLLAHCWSSQQDGSRRQETAVHRG